MSNQKVAGAPPSNAGPHAPAPPVKQGGQHPGQQALAAWEKAMKKGKGNLQGKQDQAAERSAAQGGMALAHGPMTMFMSDADAGDSADQDGQRGAMDGASAARDASRIEANEDCDFHADSLVDSLASMSANSNMFEVLMPGGTVLGVAVNQYERHVDFLMSTSDLELEKQIKRQKSAIQRGLGARLGKEIGIELL